MVLELASRTHVQANDLHSTYANGSETQQHFYLAMILKNPFLTVVFIIEKEAAILGLMTNPPETDRQG